MKIFFTLLTDNKKHNEPLAYFQMLKVAFSLFNRSFGEVIDWRMNFQ